MGIVKIKNGTAKVLSAREIKAEVQKITGWTTEEYNKQYDILRNKTRAYEAYREAHGVKDTKIQVNELIFKREKAKARYGENYEPSATIRRIEASTTQSTGKTKAVGGNISAAIEKRQAEAYKAGTPVDERFEGLIRDNAGAAKLKAKIKDPVQLEDALIKYANEMHRQGKALGSGVAGDVPPSFDMLDFADTLIAKYS